ncbi:P-loop containing nucleoside triphosphate hydrolase protein [Aspergillus spinulosporus]
MPRADGEAEPGSICEAIQLYQTRPDARGRTSWTQTQPDDLVKPAEDSTTSKYALIVRNEKSYSPEKSLSIHSIVVQSPFLKKFLANVLDGYPGLTMALDRVEFTAPFKSFIHRWKEFSEAKDQETDFTTKVHADLLYRTLDNELGDVISKKEDLVKNGVVTHQLLWTIFEPNDYIFTVIDDHQCVLAFQSGDTDSSSGDFVVSANFIDFDGETFGYRTQDLCVPYFEGTRRIEDLAVFPLRYHDSEATIRENLIARGRLWESYKGFHYLQYDGIGTGYSEFHGAKVRHIVKSRIVIDARVYNSFNPDYAVWIKDPVSSVGSRNRAPRMRMLRRPPCESEDEDLYSLPAQAMSSIPSQHAIGHETPASNKIKGTLSDEQRLIATPMLRGYALRHKKWLTFYITGLQDISWDTKAFDSLVLPHAQQHLKKFILGFARAQCRRSDNFDDVIHGKGRGLIMLLKGPPGVGKTLTAESVAEALKVPLYVMSAGDLGTDSEQVEETLRDVLTLIPRWGAVLLLDEADVFMEARDKNDIKRNKLVSIFLRLLEYYEGILFLTTNRAEQIDPAFESRIHISIQYPELNEVSRRQIWSQFLSRPNTAQFSDKELDQLAKLKLNGRQIKNVVRTAHLLAQEEDCALNYEHIRMFLELTANDSVSGSLV